MKRINMLSGGLASWATGKLIVEQHGAADLTHLFADTNYEDPDTYRFLPEAVANIGGDFVRVADGRTPWQVFWGVKFLGNTRVAPCSKKLKREVLDKWMLEHCNPADTVVYVGLMWFERQRWEGRWITRNGQKVWSPGIRDRFAEGGWKAESPLIETQLTKPEIKAWIEREGIDPPRLYDEGATSNNCAMRCVKMGQAGWAQLLRMRPESFREVEAQENEFRAVHGDVSILRDRRGGAN